MITILNTYNYCDCPWYLAVIATLAIMAIIFLAVNTAFKDDNKILFPLISSLAIGILAFILFGVNTQWFSSTTRYEIIADDEVSFNDIAEKYKIVDKRGIIYTVEERVNDN